MGQIFVPSKAGAPTNADYLTLALNGVLTNERVLTPGAGIAFVDTGPNGTLTISATAGSGITQGRAIATAQQVAYIN
jgi:hypothetical protein